MKNTQICLSVCVLNISLSHIWSLCQHDLANKVARCQSLFFVYSCKPVNHLASISWKHIWCLYIHNKHSHRAWYFHWCINGINCKYQSTCYLRQMYKTYLGISGNMKQSNAHVLESTAHVLVSHFYEMYEVVICCSQMQMVLTQLSNVVYLCLCVFCKHSSFAY